MQPSKLSRSHRPASIRAAVLLCALAFSLAACHHGPPPPPPNTTPDGAVLASIVLTRQGDFDGLMHNLLPSADYGTWRKAWGKARAHPSPATPAKRKQFAQAMQMLTQPDAEKKLFKRLEPELAGLRKRGGPQLPILIGILQASGRQVIDDATHLGPGQKQMANQTLAALMAWLQAVNFGDADKAKQAISVLCDTARKLDVKTLDQLHALDYAQAMQHYGTAWHGLVALLKIYGLDLDASLGAAKVETLSNDGNNAKVQVTLTVAGKPITGQWRMIKVGNAWYDADRLAAWRKRHPANTAPAAASSAPSSVGTAASATTTGPARASTNAASASSMQPTPASAASSH